MVPAFCVIALVLCHRSVAQNTTEIYHNNLEVDPPANIESDYHLFNNPSLFNNIFSRLIATNSPRISYRIAESLHRNDPYSINGISLHSPLDGRVDFATLTTLRALCTTDDRYNFIASPSAQPLESRATFNYSDRATRLGFSALFSVSSKDELWHLRATLSRRWGVDAYVDGVFADNFLAGVAIERTLPRGASLTLLTGIAPTNEGLRSASTLEAFSLTNNNLYNPSWGYQSGARRNSRVAKQTNPFVNLVYRRSISPRSNLVATGHVAYTKRSLSSIARLAGSDPRPDYYYNMPSYFAQSSLSDYVKSLWRSNTADVVQVDWGGIYEQNSEPHRPSYIVEGRVEATTTARVKAMMTTNLDSKTSLNYGVDIYSSRNRLYKVANDMLGADSFADVDQYIVGDELFGDKTENNLLTPGRAVHTGERFGYDCYIGAYGVDALAGVVHIDNKLSVSATAELGTRSYLRHGKYEKELYPASLSLADSKRYSFDPYKIELKVSYSRVMNEVIRLSIAFSSQAPMYGNIFYSPNYNNVAIDNPETSKHFVSHIDYNYHIASVQMQLSAGLVINSRGQEIFRYFDDLSSTYSDLSMSDVATTCAYGTLSASWELSSRLSLSGSANIISARYSSNPRVDILSDADHSVIVAKATSHLKGYKLGNIPSVSLLAQLDYRAPWGLWGRLGISHTEGRYVDPAPTRRMARNINAAGSTQGAKVMVAQSRLPASTVVNVACGRDFTILGRKVSARANVNNLLSNKNVVIYGYEQMRVRRYTSAGRRLSEPMADRFLYDYGRNYSLSISILL